MAQDEVGAGDFAYDDTINYMIRRAVNRPTCVLTLPANISVSAAANVGLVYGAGSEILDDLGWHDTSVNTSRITPTYAGRYMVTANATFASNATGTRRTMVFKNAGVTHVWASTGAVSGSSSNINVTGIIEMNGTTDYVQQCLYQDSGGALNALGTGDSVGTCYLEVTYLGDSL